MSSADISNIDWVEDWTNESAANNQENEDIIIAQPAAEENNVIDSDAASTYADPDSNITSNTPDIMICVDDVIKKNPSTMSTLEVLNNQCNIIHYVQALFSKKQGDDVVSSILEYLEWIRESSGYLAGVIDQKLTPCLTSGERIVRSSYDFCENMAQCDNFYGNNSGKCDGHHYVHSLVNYDVTSLMSYMDKHRKDIVADDPECSLTIKTICFVIRHMTKEINYLSGMIEPHDDIEKYHRNNVTNARRNKVHKTKAKIVQKEEKRFFSNRNRFSGLSID